MALFQKNPYDTQDHKPLYTLGLHKTILVVGLGNKGKQFNLTRHNLGFMAADALAEAHKLAPWVEKKDMKCQIVMGNIGETRVILCKPTTMMNLSGEAAQAVAHFYKIDNASIFAVHDELAVKFGQIRCRVGGSDAGHNGVKSLITHLGDDFGRVRIGIGSKTASDKMDQSDFVLGKLSKEEQSSLPDLLRETTAILTETIASGQLPHDTRSFII